MTKKEIATMTLAAGAAVMAGSKAVAAVDAAKLDEALKTLKTYDWGVDRKVLNPIDEAIIATHGDAAGRKALEKSLVDALSGGISRSAQDYVCRKLRIIGTDQSINALAALLPAEDTSHIARYALERLSAAKACDVMRDALPKVSDKLKPGLIGSLGVRRDEKSVAAISKFLGSSDLLVAKAAAHALGLIGTKTAANELGSFAKKAPEGMKGEAADASLLCAEQLLADGDKATAIAIYKGLQGEGMPKHVKVAATKGMLTAAAKK